MKSTTKPLLFLPLIILCSTAPAGAAPLAELFFDSFRLEDDSVEVQSLDVNGNGLLDEGDRIRGIVNFPTLVNRSDPAEQHALGNGVNNELAGIFEIEVMAGGKTATPDPDLFDYEFGPVTGGMSIPGLGPLPEGAMVVLFEDPEAEFVIGGTCFSAAAGGDCESNISDGMLALVLGFSSAADGDHRWFADDTNQDLSLGLMMSDTASLGSFNYQLDILENQIGVLFGLVETDFHGLGPGDGLIDWAGSGDVLGTAGLATPYTISNDAQLRGSLNGQPPSGIPVPGTVLLLGGGLLGLAAARHRQGARRPNP